MLNNIFLQRCVSYAPFLFVILIIKVVELNSTQLAFLGHVLKKRGRIFTVGLLLSLLVIVFALAVLIVYPQQHIRWEKQISPGGFFLFLLNIYILFMIAASIYGLWRFYNKKIKSLQKDISEKKGFVLGIPVSRKTFFEHIGAYYLFFDDHRMQYIHVSENIYRQFNIGDEFPVVIAMFSGTMMNEYRDFELW